MTDYKPEYDVLTRPCDVSNECGEVFDWALWSSYYPAAVEREVWRQVPGFSRYLVSNVGRVRDLSKDGEFVEPTLSVHYRDRIRTLVRDVAKTIEKEFGEFRYHLEAADGRMVWRHMHTLVALAFVPLKRYATMDPNVMLVRRKNRLQTDCRASNLAWVSAHELWADQQREFVERNGISRVGYEHHFKSISASIVDHIRTTFRDNRLEPIPETAEQLVLDAPQKPIWAYVPSS